MKTKSVVWLGMFLLLGGILTSELGLHLLAKHIPIVSPSYRGWGEPDFYHLSSEDSKAGHRWIVFLKLNGIVCLVGFTILYLQLRKHALCERGQSDSAEGHPNSVESTRPGTGGSGRD